MITSDFEHLLASRQIYDQYRSMVSNNQSVMDSGAIFHNWLRDNYVTFVAMSIRRQTDLDRDVISLAKLITDIQNNPQDLTRKWHRGLYGSDLPDVVKDSMANDAFTENAGEGQYFDPKIAASDLEILKKVSGAITALADREIAHRSKNSRPALTFNDVDACMDAFKEIIQRYILLLTAGFNLLEPVIDDWQNAFTTPWIKNNY